ncbi:hypothetical protein H9P43_000664 [Blastocladiella emersonii ATCC 22665]|nr:hypothetical protein H9P43_000664 [Blastocladiella emersonii ATCC 22665]
MPHFRQYDDFAAKATLLVQGSAETIPTTRCSLAVRPAAKEIRIKVTNDARTVHWHAHHADDLRKVLTFTRAMVEKMQNRQPRAAPAPAASAAAAGGEGGAAKGGKGGKKKKRGGK